MDRRNAMFLLSLMAFAGCGTLPSPPAINAGIGTLDDIFNRDPDPKRSEVVLIALSQVGLPYRWGGVSPIAGFDCSGLVVYVFSQSIQLVLPRTAVAQARAGRGVRRTDLRPGDVVFFNTMKQRYSHVGIYVGEGRFVHAPTANELIRVESMELPYWQRRFDGARRFIA